MLYILLLAPIPLFANYISMAPSVTETLYAVGLGDKVMGVSQYCRYPIEVKKKPSVGTPFTPNLERLVSLAPEIIFTQKLSDNTFIDKMKKLKLTVKELKFDSYNDILASITSLTKLSSSKKGFELIQKFKLREQLLRNLKLKGDGLVVIEIKIKHGNVVELMVAGPETYLGEIISMTNLKIQQGSKGYSYYQIEKLLLNPPEYIYLINITKRDELLLTSFINQRKLNKVKLVSLNKNYTNVPGPRVELLMRDIYEHHKN